MFASVTAFADELRRAGLPVSLSESMDASRACATLPMARREVLRGALTTTLVKDATHLPVFDTLFEVFFSARPHLAAEGDGPVLTGAAPEPVEVTGDGSPPPTLDPESLAQLVRGALLSASPDRLAALAVVAVAQLGGIEPGRPVGPSYYLFRVLRALGLSDVLAGLLEQVQAGAVPAELGAVAVRDLALRARLAAEELERNADALRRAVLAEIARQLSAELGAEAVAASLRPAHVEDVDFMHASRQELLAMRRAVRPLARVLAARLSRRRRRQRRGYLDFKATIRRSLSTGGVPVVPRFRAPRRSKPELVVLADVSGSVAAFARFTLQLVHALSSQFSAVRSFVFVDGLDEVTRIFATSKGLAEAVERVEREARFVESDGHSDYGAALQRFCERHLGAVTTKTTVLVLGDGRGNYHPARADLLADVARRARRLYWLNPEPRPYWGSGDSAVFRYEPHCDAMLECRNLRQLEDFVASLA